MGTQHASVWKLRITSGPYGSNGWGYTCAAIDIRENRKIVIFFQFLTIFLVRI